MMTDPISDLLIQMKNGYLAGKNKIEVPYSNLKEILVNLLEKEDYLGKIRVKSDGKLKKVLEIDLVYANKNPKITEIIRVSKIARRIYVKKGSIPKVLGGKGMAVISTPQGLMTDREARKKGLGGEVICKIW